jgi:hypothetical protein
VRVAAHCSLENRATSRKPPQHVGRLSSRDRGSDLPLQEYAEIIVSVDRGSTNVVRRDVRSA